ncbi:hypothetical protein B0H16DRAFT_1533897 [Mycena metata]|uniref:F-box domain-containing protein n=1 Tax=Mycena metata TaxID=1033252 RepID=A0AAD7J8P7_9AGAR|nr:hypothetical protein B0H16DRAFT_1533897 [Mycena metata]
MLDRLQRARTRVSDLDAQIQRLEVSIAILRAERLVLQEPLDSYTYPVLTLPTEITCEIFLHFLPPYPACPPITGPFSPTILTHVCRTWRDIADATPYLWSRITLSAQELSLDTQIEISDLWIRRSRSRALAIDLQNNQDQNLMGLKSLIAHRLRWERLTLRIPTSTADVPRTDGPMPLLRYLDINSLFHEDSTPLTFLDAPLLRAVVFNYKAAAMIPVPWAQLTSLTLYYIFPHECVPILAQGLNLVHCELRFVFSPEETDVVLNFTLPRLQTLILQDMYHECPSGLLTSFVVPALRTLQIPAWFFGSTPLDDLRAWILKVGCKLQKVHIIGELETSDEALRREFPTIGDLSVRQYADTDWNPFTY